VKKIDVDIKNLDETLKSLERAMNKLKELGYPIGRVRSIYGELYVTKKLTNLKPQVGGSRKYNTSADIYLEEINKYVEVKSCEKHKMTENATWVWTFGEKQIKDRKFDYAVLIGFGENSFNIEKVFVLSCNELADLRLREDSVRKEGTVYISYYDNPKDYEKDIQDKEIEDVKIEKELNKYSEKFEDRWGEIR